MSLCEEAVDITRFIKWHLDRVVWEGISLIARDHPEAYVRHMIYHPEREEGKGTPRGEGRQEGVTCLGDVPK